MIKMAENSRIYEGQDLALLFGDGSIVPLTEEEVKQVLLHDEKTGFFRIMDKTPLGRVEVIEV